MNWSLHTFMFFILFWGQRDSEWGIDKINELLLMGSVIAVSGLINFIPTFYKRPILLDLKQNNTVTDKESTTYIKGETKQSSRTIVMNLVVHRRKGWNWLLDLYVQKNDLLLKIECNPTQLSLQAVDESLKEYEILPFANGRGFFIDISEFIREVNQHNQEAKPSKQIPYFIRDTREDKLYFLTGKNILYVNPVLISRGKLILTSEEEAALNDKRNLVLTGKEKLAPRYIQWALRWSPQQHEIEFYTEGDGTIADS